METILDRVQFLCDCAGITIGKLEKEIGLTKGSIRHWGDGSPSCENLYKVASYFHVSCEVLMGHGKPADENNNMLQNVNLKKFLDEILQTILKMEAKIRKFESEEKLS